MKDYQKLLENVKLSTDTQRFLHCILLFNDSSNELYDTLIEFFGDKQGSVIYDERYYKLGSAIEDVLYYFLTESITQSLCVKDDFIEI